MVQNSSRKIKKIERDTGLYFDIIAKSPSQINVGDILNFKYQRRHRLVLVVQPVSKSPQTGNLLLTCVNISLDTRFTKELAKDLYKNRSSLGEDQYRTYIFEKIEGNLRRLFSEDSELEESVPEQKPDEKDVSTIFE